MTQLQNIGYNPLASGGLYNQFPIGSLTFNDGSTFTTSGLNPGYAQVFEQDTNNPPYPATLTVTNAFTSQVLPFGTTNPCSTVQVTNNPAISGIITGDTFINVQSNGTLTCVPVAQYNGTRSIKRDMSGNSGTNNSSVIIVIIIILIILIIIYFMLVKKKKY
ncbi:MAG: hypothetical protein Solumvirus7_4 [Solumvirus sp.]|uniref:Uncharacterized protein n=1 Tax=Solumvirus sp. TaxID=2487773 RepID=A0A3G5AKI0_9VIRU|nr:MAG: hypothetical protein Solumvirus7_4 [Solumvirus sp.]